MQDVIFLWWPSNNSVIFTHSPYSSDITFFCLYRIVLIKKKFYPWKSRNDTPGGSLPRITKRGNYEVDWNMAEECEAKSVVQ